MQKLYGIAIKIFVIITIIIILIGSGISGSFSSESIDKLAYVVALALDVGSNNNLKVTIQLANPNNSSSEASSSSSQSTASTLASVECSSIESGINLLNSYISRAIDLSHCKAIIISEELAVTDLSLYIYELCDNVQVSPHANVTITKCTASNYLKMSSPVLETFSARYYQIAPNSSKYTGYTTSVPLIDFLNSLLDTCSQPVATLGNVNISSSHSYDASSNQINKDSSYVAGETPITADNHVETMGVAVFRWGKLVGELDGLENICHMIISGKLNSCNVQIEDPEGNSENINVSIQLKNNPKRTVKLVNETPFIKIDVNLSVRMLAITPGKDYLKSETTEKLEEKINIYFKELISSYLYKTSKEFNSDIDGFGKQAIKYFLTKQEWDNYDWLNKYKDSFFEVNVSSKIRSGYSFLSL